MLGLLQVFSLLLVISLSFYWKVSCPLFLNLDLFVFQKMPYLLDETSGKWQCFALTGNRHLSCFLFGHSVFVWGKRHAWHFGILPVKKKIQPSPHQKTCLQLHAHSIDWLSSSTSISLECSYNYLCRRWSNLKKLI